MYNYLEKQETFNDVVNCIENELIDLSSQIQKYRVLQASPAVVRAYHELLTNPCANETMKEIAARVNMSQNYFSTLFKKEIGVSFPNLNAVKNKSGLNPFNSNR